MNYFTTFVRELGKMVLLEFFSEKKLLTPELSTFITRPSDVLRLEYYLRYCGENRLDNLLEGEPRFCAAYNTVPTPAIVGLTVVLLIVVCQGVKQYHHLADNTATEAQCCDENIRNANCLPIDISTWNH